MAESMRLDDSLLQEAGASLVQASSAMTSENVSRPDGDLPSLTGIGVAITLYLKGLSVARAALADAARTGAESLAGLMSESTELDRYIADALGDDFAVSRGPER